MGFKNKAKKIDENPYELCEGVVLADSFFGRTENRLLTLLLKGFLVYLLSMGSIGFYLSAFDIKCNILLVHMVVFFMAFICAALYYRLFTENVGYLILLAAFGLFVLKYKTIINSGFYAIVNITIDYASEYFGVDVQSFYNEQIENRYLTVTMVCIFIGVVLDVILNVYISRRMQYVTALVIVMFLNVIPLYLVQEPNSFYALMLLAGVGICLLIKSGKHYAPQLSITRDDRKFVVLRRKNREVSYFYDVKIMVQTAIVGLVFVIVTVSMAGSIKPKKTFNTGYVPNPHKELTMAAVSSFMLYGWAGFFHNYDNIGGMSSGKLGNVNAVHIDNQTDLIIKITPYNYDTIYIKNFTGVVYNPVANCWTLPEYLQKGDYYECNDEAYSLKEAFVSGEQYSAKGKMLIKNIGGQQGHYCPYYTLNADIDENSYIEVEYYPRLANNTTAINYENGSSPYTEEDLYVPPENLEAIKWLVDELEIKTTIEGMTNSLAKYYQENMPYTIKPGKTPKDTDFINYFLKKNKKGYCVHFASAAVLAYRYMGIPARYVEGYAVSYDQILDGELEPKAVYEDYYEGYSELGKTGLVRVNVTDADAHAWVEVYDPIRGWFVVDVTPASTEEEEVEDFWDSFDDIVNNAGNEDEDETNLGPNLNMSDELMNKIMWAIFIAFDLVAALAILVLARKYVIFIIKYNKADNNDKLIMRYQIYNRRIKKKDKGFVDCINYKAQVDYIFENYESKNGEVSYNKEEIINTLETAGFSNKPIEDKKLNMLLQWMKDYRKKKVNA